MKKITILIVLLNFVFSKSYSQYSTNDADYKRLNYIEKNINSYKNLDSFIIPTNIEQNEIGVYKYVENFKYKGNNIQKISLALTKPFENENLKVLSIIMFIVKNIDYDYCYKGYIEKVCFGYGSYNPYITILYKKTVCMGYANLFNVLCSSSNIKSGSIESKTHAYNWVIINDVYNILDVTWLDCSITSNFNINSYLAERYCEELTFEEKRKYILDYKKINPYIYNTYYKYTQNDINEKNVDKIYIDIFVYHNKKVEYHKNNVEIVRKKYNMTPYIIGIIKNKYYLKSTPYEKLKMIYASEHHYNIKIIVLDSNFATYNRMSESVLDKKIKLVFGLKRTPTIREDIIFSHNYESIYFEDLLRRYGIIY